MLNEAHRCITRSLMDLTAKSVLFLLRPTLAIVLPRWVSVHDVLRRGMAGCSCGYGPRHDGEPRPGIVNNTLVAHGAISNMAATNAAQTRTPLALAGLPHRVPPTPVIVAERQATS